MKQEANFMGKGVKNNDTDITTNKEKKGLNRRKVITSLAAVGGVSTMPSGWVKPVINSVMLPAHAQTSIDGDDVDDSPELILDINSSPSLILAETSLSISTQEDFSVPINGVGANSSGGTLVVTGATLMVAASLSSPGEAGVVYALFEANFVDSSTQFNSGQIPGGTILFVGDSITSSNFIDSAGVAFTVTLSNPTGDGTLNLTLNFL